jgi:hypothetical protein
MSDHVIEWAPFQLKSDVDEARLIKIADELQSEFIGVQEGYINRKLIKNEDGAYCDLIVWSSQTHADNASAQVNTCAACADYFALMEAKAAQIGFSRFTVLRDY